jgi:hypothetical protein
MTCALLYEYITHWQVSKDTPNGVQKNAAETQALRQPAKLNTILRKLDKELCLVLK